MTTRRTVRVRSLLTPLLAFVVLALTAAPAAGALTSTAQTTVSAVAASPAAAVPGLINPSSPQDFRAARGVCSTTAVNLDTSSLPVNRWTESMTFHSRLKASDWMTSASGIQRKGILEAQLAIGNTLWSAAAGMVEYATAFCVLDTVGGKVDRAAANLGRAILNSGILVGIVSVTIVVYLWRVSRGAGSGVGKALFSKGMVLALFMVMIAGATASTGGGISNNGAPYKPGLGSPGWVVVTVDKTVSSMASSVATAVDAKTIGGAEKTGEAGAFSCRRYVRALKDDYKQTYGKTVYAEAANTPLLLSSMWERTGLQAWKKAQFGQKNAHGDWMYCRLLEEFSGETGPDQVKIMQKIPAAVSAFGLDTKQGRINAEKSLAFASSAKVKKRDRGLVGWATCTVKGGKVEVRDLGMVKSDSESATRDDCLDFFGQDAGTDGEGTIGADYDADAFDWDDSDDDLNQVDDADDKDFLATLHGNSNHGGMVSMFVYTISAFLMMLVFGLFAGAIMVAKVAALVMMLLVFFSLTVALLPNANMGKVADYLKQYVGISLFSFGAQLLLAVLSLFTWILIDAGTTTMPGGPGGVMSMLWTGFAPLIALLVMHMGFKKMRMPSPISVSSGMGWGKAMAGGAAAGAVGGGVASMMNRGQERAKQFAKSKGSAAMHKVDPRKNGGAQKMAPKATAGAAPGAPAAGAGAGAGAAGAGRAGAAAGRRGGPDLQTMGAAGASKKEQAEAAREARAARKGAASWAQTPEGRDAVREQKRATKGTAADRMNLGWERFRQRPLATTASAAKKTAIVGGAAALGAATLGPAGAGLAYAAYRTVKSNPIRPSSAQVDAYTGHLEAQQRQQEERQQEHLRKAHASGQRENGATPSEGTVPADNGETYTNTGTPAPKRDGSTGPQRNDGAPRTPETGAPRQAEEAIPAGV